MKKCGNTTKDILSTIFDENFILSDCNSDGKLQRINLLSSNFYNIIYLRKF